MITFGEWTPDKPADASGLRVADNCYPGDQGYRPVKAFVADATAGPAPFLGAWDFVSSTGAVTIVGGTATALYKLTAGAWGQIGIGYSNPVTGRWRFAQFGELGIATNGTNPVQKVDLTTGLASDLAGSPPKFAMLAVVKDFLVGAVLNGATNQLGWCAINNAEEWIFGQNQSDYQVMPFGGDINGMFGGEFGVILQRERICRMDYIGGNEIFAISEVSSNFGCATANSVVQFGALGFFLSDNGFMQWDGSALHPIGIEKIDRYFLAAYNRAAWATMSAAVDAANKVIVWSMGDRCFAYHWQLGRWSTFSLAAQTIFSGYTSDVAGKTADGAFYVIDVANTLGRLTGANTAATWTTPDLELVKGREAQLSVVRPVTDAIAGLTLTIACRSRLGDAVTGNAYTSLQANGDMPVRERGRYARMTLGIAAGTVWTYAQGLDPLVSQGAKR